MTSAYFPTSEKNATLIDEIKITYISLSRLVVEGHGECVSRGKGFENVDASRNGTRFVFSQHQHPRFRFEQPCGIHLVHFTRRAENKRAENLIRTVSGQQCGARRTQHRSHSKTSLLRRITQAFLSWEKRARDGERGANYYTRESERWAATARASAISWRAFFQMHTWRDHRAFACFFSCLPRREETRSRLQR